MDGLIENGEKIGGITNVKSVFKKISILLMIGLLFRGDVVYSSDQSGQENQSHEEVLDAMRSMAKVEVEVSNTDILKDCAESIILNPENIIHVYLEVYPDGSINDEDFILNPNEDYRITLNYNEVEDLKEFHTGENDGHYYILSIDYATGDVSLKTIPEQGLLENDNYTYYVNGDGTVIITGCKSVDKEIVIPEEIDGRKVTMIGNWAFSYCRGLTTIKLPDTLTIIGEEAFCSCEDLTTIELPDSVTTIGDQAFEECISLTSIGLPDSLTTIGKEAFRGCSNLTSIEFPNSLSTIGEEAFSDCSSLTSVEIPDSVTSLDSSAFFDCDSLSSVELPNSIKTFDCNPFLYCGSLIDIKVSPDHETFTVIDNVLFNKVEKTLVCYPEGLSDSEYSIPEGIQTIGKRAFNSADELTSIEIPDTVTTIETGAFLNCSGLKSIIIPDSVTSIGETAFNHCRDLESIKIPDSVTEIGDEAFACCYDLRIAEIPDSVTVIGRDAFKGCDRLLLIVERDSYAEQYAEENEILYVYTDETEEGSDIIS